MLYFLKTCIFLLRNNIHQLQHATMLMPPCSEKHAINMSEVYKYNQSNQEILYLSQE